jgi:hypothetical protein
MFLNLKNPPGMGMWWLRGCGGSFGDVVAHGDVVALGMWWLRACGGSFGDVMAHGDVVA